MSHLISFRKNTIYYRSEKDQFKIYCSKGATRPSSYAFISGGINRGNGLAYLIGPHIFLGQPRKIPKLEIVFRHCRNRVDGKPIIISTTTRADSLFVPPDETKRKVSSHAVIV